MPLRIRRYGEHALLVEADSLAEVVSLHRAVRERAPAGVIDLIPAPRTLLVRLDSKTDHTDVAATLRSVAAELDEQAADSATAMAMATANASTWRIPVVYDGDDLREVATTLGLSVDDVRRRHIAARYSVALIGFAPGFYFLSGSDPVFHRIGRRASPRASLRRGAIGLAGEFTGIYPRQGPGGWQIIGHTDAALWDERSIPASRMAPGDTVELVEAAR